MSCRRWLLFTLAYLWWGTWCDKNNVWSRLHELPHTCAHEPLPVNQSGVKVLVAGIAKTGTRTMSRALYEIGMEHSYHSEDFGMFVWSDIATRYWLRRNGGHWGRLPKPGFTDNENTLDQEVLNGTSPEELAVALSRCRVDAIALDGIERVMPPVLQVSPGAKVVLLNWRTFEEWQASLQAFIPLLIAELVILGLAQTAFTVFPWGALVPLLDPLFGRPLERRLLSGGPPISQVYDTWTSIFHGLVNLRRIASMWFSGLHLFPENAEDYDGWHAEVKAAVPKERLFEWDMRKHTYEDLCAFLEVQPCPRKGRLPRAINSCHFQRDFPGAFLGKSLLLVLAHWVNVKLLTAWLPALFRRVLRLQKVKDK